MNQPIETIDSTRRLILKGAAVLALIGTCRHPLWPDARLRRGQ